MSETLSETAVIQAAGATATEAETPGPDQPRGPSLSPSRATDFMTCPLLYRFRVLDRLPEPPSPVAARGTLVHAVLERLFDEPPGGRTPQAARDLVPGQWERLLGEVPDLAAMFADDTERATWFDQAGQMLDRYFTLEDPNRLAPSQRELSVEAVLESGLTLRGYIDRLDVARTGELRIVDYKTGTAPREEYEARALFQMKFYAVALWRARGVIPKMLQLIYLGNGEIVRYAPDEGDLLATERKINALWQAIDRARSTEDWRPRPSRLCEWCSHQAICPAFGGIPPPLPRPDDQAARAVAADQTTGAANQTTGAADQTTGAADQTTGAANQTTGAADGSVDQNVPGPAAALVPATPAIPAQPAAGD